MQTFISVRLNFPKTPKPYEAFFIRRGEVWQAQLGATIEGAIANLKKIMSASDLMLWEETGSYVDRDE